jgi:hypothetical protein
MLFSQRLEVFLILVMTISVEAVALAVNASSQGVLFRDSCLRAPGHWCSSVLAAHVS